MNALALGAAPARPPRPLWPVDDGRRPRWAALGVAASVALHLVAFAALGASARRPAPAPAAPRRVIEIETLPPKPAPAAPPEPALAEAPAPAPAPRPPRAARR
ncbi:MAG TPA: hypothetical protein VFS00_26150, partial [Polyangiaceae bacterium]|nr:hypothetical protein [Polyangiaceae bacterium]